MSTSPEAASSGWGQSHHGDVGKTKGQCIFCDYVGVLHKEDALPKWVGRAVHAAMPPQGKWEATRVASRTGKPTRQHTKVVGNPSAVKLPLVCQENCNGGWMSRLENKTKPILEPMIADSPTALSAGDRFVLATWLTKTALVHELIEDDSRVATDEDRRWFGKRQEPLPRSEMLLARYEGTLAAVFHTRRTIILRNVRDPKVADSVYAQLFTLVIGTVVLQAIIPKQPTPTSGRFTREPSSLHVTLWPGETSVAWPPAASLDDENLASFTEVPMPGLRPRI